MDYQTGLFTRVCLQDGLLSQGNTDLINRLHSRIPKVTADGKRLQMVVCSATLHSPDVRKMAVSSVLDYANGRKFSEIEIQK